MKHRGSARDASPSATGSKIPPRPPASRTFNGLPIQTPCFGKARVHNRLLVQRVAPPARPNLGLWWVHSSDGDVIPDRVSILRKKRRSNPRYSPSGLISNAFKGKGSYFLRSKRPSENTSYIFRTNGHFFCTGQPEAVKPCVRR